MLILDYLLMIDKILWGSERGIHGHGRIFKASSDTHFFLFLHSGELIAQDINLEFELLIFSA